MINHFSFRFNTVLKAKKTMEDNRKSEFGFAIQKQQSEETKLIHLLTKRNEIIKKKEVKAKKVFKIKEMKELNSQIKMIDDLIVQQRKVLREKEEAVNHTRKELIQASKAKKTFEILKEKDYEVFKYEQAKDEESLVDQLVSYKAATR
ncbi:flagellar export protein FliJ [Alkaliphilus metalliredigens QYMF]|uniref:Flagellar FliJ protein n=1 Tax=Alkaliphilus metalliredigens (strain QYMF) TaxID=293826 RepID=A6TRQ5_ALKMQ|nr:flagellar export protein FliJ [Alkaliphilus metalliredigens]ABR48873.1 flagellar export protein FliJ [Alkaliphilus metalliredigens QYMF]